MAPITSHANYKYFVTFIDDYSRFTWIYFLHSKDEVFPVFKIFHVHIQTQFQPKSKSFILTMRVVVTHFWVPTQKMTKYKKKKKYIQKKSKNNRSKKRMLECRRKVRIG